MSDLLVGLLGRVFTVSLHVADVKIRALFFTKLVSNSSKHVMFLLEQINTETKDRYIGFSNMFYSV